MPLRQIANIVVYLVVVVLIGSLIVPSKMYAQEPTAQADNRSRSPYPGSREDTSTPALIEQAWRNGDIDEAHKLLYLGYAVYQPAALPAKYRGSELWSLTFVDAQWRQEVHYALAHGPVTDAQVRTELSQFLAQAENQCDQSADSLSIDTGCL